MEIPFASLRYHGLGVQDWGFNFQRNIRRNNEAAFWAPIPRQFDLNRLSLAGTVTGIDVPKQRNFKITPYALAKTNEGGELDSREDDTEFEATYTSAIFGFVDDISVRLRRSDKCVIPSHSFCWSTAVDVRSRSRDGESDLGANAKRICTFYDRLWTATGLRPDQSRHRCLQIGRFTARP